MPDSSTLTRKQLMLVYAFTELGGSTGDADHFAYAKRGNSSYTFGTMQFDVGSDTTGRGVKKFLKANGFDDDDIHHLSQHGGLSRQQLDRLDGKLQSIPQAKVDDFTNEQLDESITRVGRIIDSVRMRRQDTADAILSDAKLQLSLADYVNQFGPKHDNQLANFLAGNAEKGICVSGEPTREDVQRFIRATPYGRDPANARAVAGREAHFNIAMAKLGLGPAIEVTRHAAAKADGVLRRGDRGPGVHDLQTKLAELGYADSQGQRLQADGDFGPATQAAVERFQNAHSLAVDGKVGPATWRAVHADVQALQRDDPGLLPSIAAMSSLPAAAPGPDDPRSPFNPHHALFDDLKYRFPDASDNRLLQFTTACQANGITKRNLSDVRFDQQNGVVSFAGRISGEPFHGVSVDVKEPSPPALQSIQQLQRFDQYQTDLQATIQATIQAQITQTDAQAQQGPVLGTY